MKKSVPLLEVHALKIDTAVALCSGLPVTTPGAVLPIVSGLGRDWLWPMEHY